MTLIPPAAKAVPTQRVHHGDAVTDEYAWLADPTDPDTLSYLQAENAYTEAMTAPLRDLREQVFHEIKSRTQESDLTVPVSLGGYWYYTRTVEGRQYDIHCRRPVAPGEIDPPATGDGASLPGEQVLLDGNELATGHEFFALGVFEVSPDGNWLAFSTDFAGDERYTLRVKDLRTGEVMADEIPRTYGSAAWSLDAAVLFYLTVDDAWRPHRVWRHVVGTDQAADQLVYDETDARFWVDLELTRSQRYVLIHCGSRLTAEVRYLRADQPYATPQVIAPRRQGVDYSVDHDGDRFLILHNDGAVDFELAWTPQDAPGAWVPLVKHSPGTRLISVDALAGYVVVALRSGGLTGLRVLPRDGQAYDITFPEPIYSVEPGINPAYPARFYRLHYESMVTPESVYDCDLASGELIVRKRKPVLGGYDPQLYEQVREWVTASDGAQVPISLVCRKGTARDGRAPLLLYGYGSYEASMDPWFSAPRLSLLDRGMVFAVAHVRGGGELGRSWYDQGKLMAKRNTFTDFVACARYLVEQGWTSADRLAARGGSAGGLLIGAVLNLAPEAFCAVVAQVPFVDPLTSMLDPSKPLTVTEWEEWGNPLEDPQAYRYMKSYAPYENITAGPYPPILAMTSLHDTRVLYAEPAKWVARLRRLSPQTKVLLKTEIQAGHAGPSGRYSTWREEAFWMSWVLDQVGLAGPPLS